MCDAGKSLMEKAGCAAMRNGPMIGRFCRQHECLCEELCEKREQNIDMMKQCVKNFEAMTLGGDFSA